MVDITMCPNDQCPACKSCYRFMAKPGMRQSWAAFEPDPETRRCESFMPIGTKVVAALQEGNND